MDTSVEGEVSAFLRTFIGQEFLEKSESQQKEKSIQDKKKKKKNKKKNKKKIKKTIITSDEENENQQINNVISSFPLNNNNNNNNNQVNPQLLAIFSSKPIIEENGDLINNKEGEKDEEENNKQQQQQKDDEEEEEEERKLIQEDPSRLERTIFVGNLPLDTTKKQLNKLFKRFGPIDSIRFRSVPFQDLSRPRKVSLILKDFNTHRGSFNAYIVFEQEDSAEQALQANNEFFEGKHIRVDKANNSTFETNLSIFVGNLPFTVEEEDLRKHFEECGDIEAVRVVRDKTTNIGKGFAFILFSDKIAVSNAVKLHGSLFGKREVRVFRASNNPQSFNSKKGNSGRGGRGRGGRGGGGRGGRGGGKSEDASFAQAAERRVKEKTKKAPGKKRQSPKQYSYQGMQASPNDVPAFTKPKFIKKRKAKQALANVIKGKKKGSKKPPKKKARK